MSTLRSRLLAATAIAGVAATSLSACQVYPGDYRVYRITQLPVTYGTDCPEGFAPDPRDTTTFFSASTVAMFASDSDSYFLEFGPAVMTGTRDGSNYNFAGEDVQVEGDADGPTTTTTIDSLAVALSLKNKEIYGDFTSITTFNCNGECDGVDNYTCTVTGKFFGSEINGVELEYPVGGGAPQP